jgi:hypothetical protein
MKITPCLILWCALPSSAQEVWTQRYYNATNVEFSPRAISGKPGLYLVSSNSYNGTARSTNGVTWSDSGSSPGATLLFTAGDTIFGFYQTGLVIGIIWRTTDGLSYPPVILGNLSNIGNPSRPFAAGNSCLIIITSSGGIYRASTPDGPWLPQLSPSDYLDSIVFGNNLFLASDSSGNLIQSPDGITWATLNVNCGGRLRGFLNGIFFTSSGTYSTDNGATWNDRPADYPTGGSTNRAIGAGAGGFAIPVGNTIRTSTNYLTWTARPSGLNAEIGPIAFCGDLWVAASPGGRIITAPVAGASPIPIPTLTITPAIALTWPTVAGRRYQIQTSSDNLTWTDSGLLHSGTGTPFQYLAPATNPHQFYRLQTR